MALHCQHHENVYTQCLG